MTSLVKILTGIFFLIAMYLLLARGKESVAIIESIASNSVAGIRTLQGR